MKVAIHQPNFLPWIGYFDKMDQVDVFVLLDTADHTKSGYINRNKIKTPQGSKWLTVPIKDKGIPIKEVTIDNAQNWQRKHWKMIESNYQKCAYWVDYKDGFENIFNQDWENLSELNKALIFHIKDLLHIDTKILVESEFQINFGHGSARNLNIVKHLNGTVYVSGVGAKEYNDELEFERHKVKLVYQNFTHPVYPQRFEGFISNLSIIDMIFNCGPDTITIIRKQRLG